MVKPVILCVDDQRDVLAAMKKNLEPLAGVFDIMSAESAGEADELLHQLIGKQPVPLIICDHIMPGENGIDFLIRLGSDPRFKNTRKILLTGLATHQDTIRAINEAHIDRYLEKPWHEDRLLTAAGHLVTRFVVESGLDCRSIRDCLDPEQL
ncbi:MAG TPA: response regulator [bacterium]|nr:response regulator [bacterium]